MNRSEPVSVLDGERKEKIKDIVCDILEIEPAEVTETSMFKEDHDADSLRAIEILAALERTFDIVIDQAELSRMENLQGVYAVVDEALEA
ncbi:acyl carrier protein [Actinoallomurus spadix]|uniref:Carrier domain-containing protein n=1 Tax=Actinoallomurus spadix TaxID=79912 RepID=A0ABN0XUW0_9ACTN|nr:acyl carrier protein [Actinoallomurus spadix]MCO5991417.1 acyl carrier protein [Actinoallomurus spadix]